jgi:diguanylate cyclase (GGDEF)-like protein
VLVKAAIRDATKRLDTERQLRASEEQWRTSLESMLDGFAILRSVRVAGAIDDFEWVYINGAGAATYGATPSELVGTTMANRLPSFAGSSLFDEMCHVVETDQPLDRTSRGSVEATLLGVFDSRYWKLGDGFAVTWRDVTDMQRATEALRVSEERFRASVNNLSESLSVFSAVRDQTGSIIDFRWEFANPASSAITAFSPEALVGQLLLDTLPEQGPSGMIDTYRQVVETGEPWAEPSLWYEDVWGDGTRSRHCFDVRATKIGDGFVVVTRDVTAERLAEEELARRGAELEAANGYLEVRSRSMTLLAKGTDALQRCARLDEALEIIGRATPLVFDATPGALYEAAFGSGAFQKITTWESFEGLGSIDLDQCWALRSGTIHTFGDDPLSLRCRHTTPDIPWTVCIPLSAQGETIALICLESTDGGGHGRRKQEIAELLSTQWGLTLANLRLRESLREQSVRDALTGLFNRRYLDEALSQEVHRAERGHDSLCVAIMDLDHFKSFNDTHGHPAGDAVLRDFGRFLLESTRGEDVVCRYGGEEFVLVMAKCGEADGVDRMEGLQTKWRRRGVEHRSPGLGLYPTISAGVACYHPGLTGAEMLVNADRALYEAKGAGRDRVVVATS